MGNSEIEITSVDELLEQREQLPPGDWIYRGVDDSGYKLEPSIGRIRHKTVEREIGINDEEKALFRFRDKARPYIQRDVKNDLEWMIIGQHHGMPTRLLDWTRSPLVAAYFAATRIHRRQYISDTGEFLEQLIDGAVYAVRIPEKVDREDWEKPFNVKDVKLIDPTRVTERVVRQESVFTIHAKPLEDWNPPDIQKFLIPNICKFAIKKDLDERGISEAELFPGVDAIARYTGWQLKWDRLV